MDGLIRQENGRFAAGTAPGPGRPKGQSLKEFARQYLMDLPEKDKREYLAAIPKEMVWRMSEGNPAQEQELKGNITIEMVNYANKDSA